MAELYSFPSEPRMLSALLEDAARRCRVPRYLLSRHDADEADAGAPQMVLSSYAVAACLLWCLVRTAPAGETWSLRPCC